MAGFMISFLGKQFFSFGRPTNEFNRSAKDVIQSRADAELSKNAQKAIKTNNKIKEKVRKDFKAVGLKTEDAARFFKAFDIACSVEENRARAYDISTTVSIGIARPHFAMGLLLIAEEKNPQERVATYLNWLNSDGERLIRLTERKTAKPALNPA